MKTYLLALVLALASLDLWAQSPPSPIATSPAARKLARMANTNGMTMPRYTSPAPGGLPSAAASASALPGLPRAATPLAPAAPAAPGGTGATAASSTSAAAFASAAAEEVIPAGRINWQGVELNQVLEIYAQYVGRTLIRGNLPDAKIILKTETPLTKTEVIQALLGVLALNNISLINIGDKFVKVVPSDQANTAAGELDRSGSTNLPVMGSYVTHITQLHYVKPSVMQQVITPFAKLPNAIFPIDDNGILVIRDYAENVKRMLEMIEQIDVSVPAEYISEVIPIRYAKVDDIASALNSLGGGGGSTVSIGTSPGNSQISGLAGSRLGGGMGGMGGMGGGMGGSMGGMNSGMSGSAFGNRTGMGSTGANPNGTPTGGSTFAQRLNNIINSAGGGTSGGGGAGGKQEQIVLFGQTKIIPNESSSSLLIYATRQDLEVIKGIIAKLDVPLSQVLVEAVIIDVTLGNSFNFGTSVAQNPKSFTGVNSTPVVGGGGFNNGPSFANFLGMATNGTASVGTNAFSSFANSLGSGSGLSYFGNLGPTWDVAVQAAESDSHASIIQRPRIQTSQAKPAQFFVGDTVPYVTGTYNYGGAYGNQSSYSQLSVGVELDVTPFINPEGMVSMDIQQEIDDLNGSTHIDNVGDIPNTIKRTLNTSITVRDRDTVMLGGFIKSDKSHTQSGVPFLQDIPLLGNLFKQRTDKKGREELIVLMRPTVLKTPELLAKHTNIEEQRLPGVSEAAAEDAAYERTLIDAQRKREQKKFKATKQYDGFFVPAPEETNTVSLPSTNTSETK